jgi:hypothetical protein
MNRRRDDRIGGHDFIDRLVFIDGHDRIDFIDRIDGIAVYDCRRQDEMTARRESDA